MTATPAWLASIEALLNRGIENSLQATTLAERLEGTALRVSAEGIFAARASIARGTLNLSADDERAAGSAQPNATITGSPLALLNLVRGSANRARAPGVARVMGDAEIALLYRQLFALAKPDFEEELSHLVGDTPARHLSRAVSRAFGWASNARRAAGENIAEYLQEESRVLVNRTELDEFLKGVDELREIADRVETRLSRLEQRTKGTV